MGFLNNNNFKSSDEKSKNAIFDFFQETNKDDLAMMANSITEDAKEFFVAIPPYTRQLSEVK